jgi:hypothetical protein
VRLHEDAVNLFEVDDTGLVADGLDQRRDTEFFGSTQQPFAGAHDEGERICGEGMVAESGAIPLSQDKRFGRLACEARQHQPMSLQPL